MGKNPTLNWGAPLPDYSRRPPGALWTAPVAIRKIQFKPCILRGFRASRASPRVPKRPWTLPCGVHKDQVGVHGAHVEVHGAQVGVPRAVWDPMLGTQGRREITGLAGLKSGQVPKPSMHQHMD